MNPTTDQLLTQIEHAAGVLGADVGRVETQAQHYFSRKVNAERGKLHGFDPKGELTGTIQLIELDLDRVQREINFIRENCRKITDAVVLGEGE